MTDIIRTFKLWATKYKNSWGLIISFVMMLIGLAALFISVVAVKQ